MDTYEALIRETREFQRATFPEATPHSIAEHLRREAEELCRNPTDADEMADIFMLLAGASRNHDLAAAVRSKLDRNKARSWGKPDAHGVCEHIRSTTEEEG